MADPDREARIEAWAKPLREQVAGDGGLAYLSRKRLDEALALMRAAPAPAAGGVEALESLRDELERWIGNNRVGYTDHEGQRGEMVLDKIRGRAHVLEAVVREIDRRIDCAPAAEAERIKERDEDRRFGFRSEYEVREDG